MYVPLPDWSAGWEPSRLLLLPSPSLFANYSGVLLHSSDVEKVHFWWIEISEFLVLALISFISAAREDVFMLRTADPRIDAEGMNVLVPMPKRLSR